MATKLQRISELSQSTSNGLCSYENWTAFLRSAAWQYKYPFEDQLLIFAQRPDAKACADFDTWNGKHFRRRINRGAKGIALLRENGGEYYLDHVFDVSDTNRHINGIEVKLWQYEDKYYEAVTETLQNRYGEFWYESKAISDTLLCTGQNIVLDNKEDYLQELKYAKINSFLEDYDEHYIDKVFQQIAETSVAYMAMVRMGIEPDDYIVREDFEGLWDFNTPETMSILGGAVSSFAEEILREVQSTINAEKIAEKNNAKFFAEQNQPQYNIDRGQEPIINETERTDDNDGNHLQNGERDTDTQFRVAGEPDRADRQIRDDAEETPDAEPPQPVLGNDDTGNTSVTPLGDRQDSERASGTDDTADGESRRDNREAESRKPDEMDRTYEQPQTFRRRGSGSTVSSQLSLFDLIEEGNVADSMAREAERLNNIRPAFSIPQEIIDIVLCDGASDRFKGSNSSKQRICVQYQKQFPLAENVEFLKEEYGKGGKGFVINGQNVSVWFDDGGIKIQYGKENNENTYTLTWEKAAERIGELLDLGRYMPQNEIDQTPYFERHSLADRIMNMYHDAEEKFDIGIFHNGNYSVSDDRLAEALDNPAKRDIIIKSVRDFAERFEQDRSILRFARIHNPSKLAKDTEDLLIPRKIYKAEGYTPFEGERFITQNEVDTYLARGSGYDSLKMDTISLFAREKDAKKRADFLKNRYGIGGGTAFNDGYEDHNAKGITFKRGGIMNPYDTITMSWAQVVKRIDQLIKTDRFINSSDIDNMPLYEKYELARDIRAAYSHVPMERYRPYPYGYDYSDSIPIIMELLDNRDKLTECLIETKALFMETPQDDRSYEYIKAAAENLEKYVEGTFNLFPGIERPTPTPQEELDEAMRVINEYVKEEFDSDSADYEDLRAVSLAFTSTEDGEHNIEVNVNLIDFSLLKYVDKTLVEEVKYDSLAELIRNELEGMSFDDLVYLTDEQLAPFYKEDAEANKKPVMELYNELHAEDNGKTVVLFPVGNFYELYAEDAIKGKTELDIHIFIKEIDGISYSACGFPDFCLENYVNILTEKGYDVVITDDEQKSYKVLSREKALATEPTPQKRPLEERLLDFSKDCDFYDYIKGVDADSPEDYVLAQLKSDLRDSVYVAETLDAFVDIRNELETDSDWYAITGELITELENLYQSLEKEPEEITEAAETPQTQHLTREQRNYRFINDLAPGFLEGNTRHITFSAGKGYEPFTVHRLVDNYIYIGHTYEKDGDLMNDPLMEFVVDTENKALIPKVYRNDELGIVHSVENGTANEAELSETAENWFNTIAPYGYKKEQEVIEYGDEDIRIIYDRNGKVAEIMGEPDTVNRYAEEYGIELAIQKHSNDMPPSREVFDSQIELTADCAGYEAFKSDAELLWSEKDGDSLVGLVSYEWVKTICSMNSEDLRKYVEEYTEYKLNPYRWLDSANEQPSNDAVSLVGKELDIDDRKFIVDSINETSGSVSLKDITFQEDTGFPIFRRESIDFVKAHIEQQTNDSITPEFEKPKPSKVANTVVYPEIPMSERRNFVIDNDELGYGGAKEKFRKNMEAIRVLKECEAEHRLATPEEQEILSEYVGWGGLADAFDDSKPNWSNEYKELSNALTPDEYAQARESTLNAHYTSPTIIKAMYKALENTGFTQGNILEPSCGIGNFMGLVPESMSESKIYGIEIDSITGRIAQQLYQKNSVAIQGFEDTTLPDSFFDVAIGNVPFGDYKVADKKYNKHNFLIHDYFFAKTLDKVRPGGIVAFITSSGTMDKQNSNVRKYIAQRADLVGAIRLPNNAFKANAGTEVTADILFLQKRDKMTDIMPDWVHLGTLENGITVNQYFADNPDMILGNMEMVSGPFGPTLTCSPYEDVSLAEQLDEAIQNIHATITEYEYADVSSDAEQTIPADPNVKNFSYTIVDGNIYFRENSTMRKVEMNATAENRIKGMIGIRDCVRQLIEYQTEGYSDYDIKAQQDKLNRLYDDFTKKYGLINSRGNAMAFSDDSSYFLLCSLEVIDENGELERKADMFTKRTIGAKQEIKSVDTASEALAVSLSEKAKVDMDFMMSLTGKTEDELVSELKGVIFFNYSYVEGSNIHDKYLTADEFLSGNVRDKYKTAKWLAEKDDRFKPHAEALEKVQPQDLTASEITVRLGSTWIPPEYIKEFTFELLGTSYYARQRVDIKYSEITGEWNVSEKSADKGIKAVSTYGTSRASAYKIIEETLNLKDVRIFDYHEDENGKRVAVLNRKETTLAQQKQDLIKAEFDNWIWKSPERRERLTTLYNERFNSNRPREYDGSHITFSGMNPEIELRQHQKNAVARIMYGGNSLLGHVVGAGKTWTMVAAAMESKRLGLCNKSLFVVPNHLTEQWASEFLQLYPAANILVATKKDFETKNRKKFCGRIATGDYDAVIIGHSQFEKIPMSVERQRKILEGQLKEIMDGIIELKAQKAERYTVKQLVKSQRAIQGKLAKLNDQSRKDDVVTFEELGVDRIFIDEAHYYKNLYLYTKMRNVGGIAQTEAQKSSDLFMKTQYLDEITGNKGVIFATGTPVSNSMVELYTMQRYLQYKALQEKHLQHFDAWASTFGETITAIELAPEGTGYRAKTRFAKFFNLPELMSMFKDVADIQTADMLNLPTPTPHYKTIAVEPTEIQKDMVKALAERAEDVRDKKVDPTIDNMLKITNDGRKLALDQRLINPLLPDDDESKVSNCAREVFGIWQETADKRSTQLVFCDLSTPKDDGTFDVYNDIRNKLIKNGVPDSEIAFIHTADTEVKKKELFSKVRKGDVRILLGSTPKMGAGTNVQRLLYASHDLDCPWRPADLEQRAGRIIRQGNTNSDVHICRYVTKDTFDSYMWQLVENKQKFISQIMTSKTPARSAEDIDETALSYAEIKALATGNPHIKEKMDLDTQIAKLKLIKSSFLTTKYDLEDKVIKYYPKQIAEVTERIGGYERDIETVKQYPKKDDFFNPMTVDGVTYTEKEAAGKALLERCRTMKSPEPVVIGDYRGFAMELSFDEFSKVFNVALKGNLSHKIELGTDVHGNIQRLDNALEGIEKRLEATKEHLTEVKNQFELAKVESQKEFPQEAELAEKLDRLAVVEALLNMDKPEREGADLGEPDEDMEMPLKKVVGLER